MQYSGKSRFGVKGIAVLAAASALAVGAVPASANTTLANISVTQTGTSFTFTGGAGGTFGTNGGVEVSSTYQGGGANNGETLAGSLFQFGPITETAPVMRTALGGGLFYDTAAFSGGSFSIMSASNILLLSGSYSGAMISGLEGSTSGTLINLGLNNVTYTGGVYRSRYLNAGAYSPATTINGNMSLSLSGITPGLSVGSSGYLNAFSTPTAGSTGTFDTVAVVPEPASVAAFGLGALGLAALGLRARKTRRLA